MGKAVDADGTEMVPCGYCGWPRRIDSYCGWEECRERVAAEQVRSPLEGDEELAPPFKVRHTVREVWGLRYGNRILKQGYSGRELTSPEDVRGDFDKGVLAKGDPVLLRSVKEMIITYREEM